MIRPVALTAALAVATGAGGLAPASITTADAVGQPPLARIPDAAVPGPGVSAQRGVPARQRQTCDLELASRLGERHGAGQYVIVRSETWSSTTALVDVVTVVSDDALGRLVPICQLGSMPAMVGSNGTRPLVNRRSGDGTAPAGLFGLGVMTGWDGESFSIFGNSADPGVRVPYRRVQTGDCWGATPGRSTYNKLYFRPNCPGPDDEYLPAVSGAYSHAAVIDANLSTISGDAPGEPPYAAAIFLHRHAFDLAGRPKPTRGCVSLALDDLVATLNLLDPAQRPRFAIGPRDWLSTTSAP